MCRVCTLCTKYQQIVPSHHFAFFHISHRISNLTSHEVRSRRVISYRIVRNHCFATRVRKIRQGKLSRRQREDRHLKIWPGKRKGQGHNKVDVKTMRCHENRMILPNGHALTHSMYPCDSPCITGPYISLKIQPTRPDSPDLCIYLDSLIVLEHMKSTHSNSHSNLDLDYVADTNGSTYCPSDTKIHNSFNHPSRSSVTNAKPAYIFCI